MSHASALPRDVLSAVLWSTFDRDGADVPAADSDGTIEGHDLALELEHRQRATAMALVSRGWQEAVGGDVCRRMLVTNVTALARLVDGLDGHEDVRVLIYSAPLSRAGAVLLAHAIASMDALRAMFAHDTLSSDEHGDVVYDGGHVDPPSRWPRRVINLVIPSEWGHSAVTQCPELRSVQFGFLCPDALLDEDEVDPAGDSPFRHGPAAGQLRRLAITIAPYPIDDPAIGDWLAHMTSLTTLHLKYITSEELNYVFGASSDAARGLRALRHLTLEAVGHFELSCFVNLPATLQSIVINADARRDIVDGERLSMVSAGRGTAFLREDGLPHLQRLRFDRDWMVEDEWAELREVCGARQMELIDAGSVRSTWAALLS